jgi:hypothetical protein
VKRNPAQALPLPRILLAFNPGYALQESRGIKMNRRLDIEKVDAALRRAAYKAVHGTREERSGRYRHVQSSVMTSIGYDNETQALDITFTSGETYRYSNVPRDIYAALLNAESKGEFFNDHVKGIFPFTKVDKRSPD